MSISPNKNRRLKLGGEPTTPFVSRADTREGWVGIARSTHTCFAIPFVEAKSIVQEVVTTMGTVRHFEPPSSRWADAQRIQRNVLLALEQMEHVQQAHSLQLTGILGATTGRFTVQDATIVEIPKS